MDGTNDRVALAEGVGCPRDLLDKELDALARHAILIG